MRRGDWGGGTALGPPLLLPPPQARRRRSGTSPSPNSRQGSGRGGGCAFWAIFRLFSLLILFPPPSAPLSPSALSLFEIQTLCVVCFFFNFPSESAVSFPFLIFLVFFFSPSPPHGPGAGAARSHFGALESFLNNKKKKKTNNNKKKNNPSCFFSGDKLELPPRCLSARSDPRRRLDPPPLTFFC